MDTHRTRFVRFTLTTAAVLAASACSSTAPRGDAPSSAAPVPPATAKAPDAKPAAPSARPPAPGSRFAALQPGMDMDKVQQVLGRAPDRTHTYETGKRWIPFYFASDARRLQALYKGEGCLTFTGGNAWGGGGGELIEIEADVTGACYDT